jgi:integrase
MAKSPPEKKAPPEVRVLRRPGSWPRAASLRQGEALDLTWDWVDRARGVILLEMTKSGRRRQIPLNQNADAVLARRGSSTAEGLVFGDRWERYQTAWERARARAKLADVRYHDLRHTFVSWAVQRRVSLLELRDLLDGILDSKLSDLLAPRAGLEPATS